MKWIVLPLKRYAEFSGRSRRTEFWMFFLANLILWIIFFAMLVGSLASSAAQGMSETQILQMLVGYGVWFVLFAVVSLALLIPWLALIVRRLHDIDFSGHWIWIMAAPYLGALVLTFADPTGSLTGSGLAVGANVLNLLSFAGWFVLMILAMLRGTSGPNRYGEDPKGAANSEVFA